MEPGLNLWVCDILVTQIPSEQIVSCLVFKDAGYYCKYICKKTDFALFLGLKSQLG